MDENRQARMVGAVLAGRRAYRSIARRRVSLVTAESRGAIQRVIGAAAVAITAPYLALKVAWLAGSTIGMADPAAFASPMYVVGNLATIGMDAVAILLALALTRPWGRRLPAGLVLFPAWVAIGFLAPLAVIMLGAPAAFADPALAEGALRPWVYLLVYGAFAAQGLLLMAAFALYARERWGAALRGRHGAARPGPASAARPGPASAGRTTLISVAVALAAAVGALDLAWARGAHIDLPAAVVADPPVAHRLTSAVYAAFALAAAAGLPLLARRARRGGRLWAPLVLTWAGGGSLFAYGGWQLATMAANPTIGTPLLAVATGVRVLAGILVGTVAASLLTGCSGSTRCGVA